MADPRIEQARERLREVADHLTDLDEAAEAYDRVTAALRAVAAFVGVGPREISDALGAEDVPGLTRGEMSPRAVSAVLRNRRVPKMKWLLAYVDVFGTDLPTLLEFAWGWNADIMPALIARRGSLRGVDAGRVEREHGKLLASVRRLTEFRHRLSQPLPPLGDRMAEPIPPWRSAGPEEPLDTLSQMVSAGQNLASGLPSLVQWRSGEEALPEQEDPALDDDPMLRMLDLAVDTGIPDLSTNIDHYLYGHPKAGHEA